jgi:hypothetical protein
MFILLGFPFSISFEKFCGFLVLAFFFLWKGHHSLNLLFIFQHTSMLTWLIYLLSYP